MAVNVPVENLHDEWLPDVIGERLDDHGLPPGCLQLEVTIDDFGTGYSSLSYLHEIPANTVKIDRSLVTRMLENRRVGRIVESTIALSHYLNMTVVAEGVDGQAEMDALAAYGCDMAQGYYLARPMEALAVEHWLGQGAWPKARTAASVGTVWAPRAER